MGKGADFEREICRDLSLWWTRGERDDVFWRSSQSGGRATFRAQKGRSTFGSYGDVSAVDPVGRPLLDLFTIELKKGYGGKGTAFDAIDNLPRFGRVKPCQWEEFISQVMKDAELAKTPLWLLLHRRPKRATVAFFPYEFQKLFPSIGREPAAILALRDRPLIAATTWENFKREVDPLIIAAASRPLPRRLRVRIVHD